MDLVTGLVITGALVVVGVIVIKKKEETGFRCGSLLGKTCAAGETCVNGVCTKPAAKPGIPTCTSGKVYNTVTKTCVPGCGTGQIYDTIQKKCTDITDSTEQTCIDQCSAQEDDLGAGYTCQHVIEGGICDCDCQRDTTADRVRAFYSSGGIPFDDTRMSAANLDSFQAFAYNAVEGQTLPFFRQSFDKTRHSRMKFSGQW